jgi:hypothetical protein
MDDARSSRLSQLEQIAEIRVEMMQKFRVMKTNYISHYLIIPSYWDR